MISFIEKYERWAGNGTCWRDGQLDDYRIVNGLVTKVRMTEHGQEHKFVDCQPSCWNDEGIESLNLWDFSGETVLGR